MNFEEAFKELLAGKKITRGSWYTTYIDSSCTARSYIVMYDDKKTIRLYIYFSDNPDDFKHQIIDHDYGFHISDVQATDWEIFDK